MAVLQSTDYSTRKSETDNLGYIFGLVAAIDDGGEQHQRSCLQV
jgi:hypothetical protein